jgi:hypothetical protein
MYMHEDPALKERKAKVFTIKPKLASKLEAFPKLNKTDRLEPRMGIH